MLVTEIADKKREKVVLTFGESTTTLQHHNFHYISICVFRKLSCSDCNSFCIEDFLQDEIKIAPFLHVEGLTGLWIKAKHGDTMMEIHIPLKGVCIHLIKGVC